MHYLKVVVDKLSAFMKFFALAFALCVFPPFLCTYYAVNAIYDCISRRFLSYPAAGKNIFITGCDTGFGHLAAIRLAEEGYNVYASCLSEKGKAELQAKRPDIKVFTFDVTNAELLKQAIAQLDTQCGTEGLWAVFNNAGIGQGQFIECADLDSFRRTMEVNCFAGIEVTRLCAPILRRYHAKHPHENPRVVNMTSVAGIMSHEGMASYHCSKFAFEAASDCLRKELGHFGILVSIVEPGFTRTPILNLDAKMALHADSIDKLAQTKESKLEKCVFKHYKTATLKNSRLLPKLKNLAADPRGVVDIYVLACQSIWPRLRYVYGATGYYGMAVSTFPTHLGDLLDSLAGMKDFKGWHK